MFASSIRYFWPRNEKIFNSDIATNLSAITIACEEWQNMNWVRSSIEITAFIFQFMGLHEIGVTSQT